MQTMLHQPRTSIQATTPPRHGSTLAGAARPVTRWAVRHLFMVKLSEG
jgi:hypothetical protein